MNHKSPERFNKSSKMNLAAALGCAAAAAYLESNNLEVIQSGVPLHHPNNLIGMGAVLIAGAFAFDYGDKYDRARQRRNTEI